MQFLCTSYWHSPPYEELYINYFIVIIIFFEFVVCDLNSTRVVEVHVWLLLAYVRNKYIGQIMI